MLRRCISLAATGRGKVRVVVLREGVVAEREAAVAKDRSADMMGGKLNPTGYALLKDIGCCMYTRGRNSQSRIGDGRL